jgi:hypothetical protein
LPQLPQLPHNPGMTDEWREPDRELELAIEQAAVTPDSIPVHEIHSSQIHSWGYDAANETLTVCFRTLDCWEYWPIPVAMAHEMHRCSSAGGYFHVHVKPYIGRKFEQKQIRKGTLDERALLWLKEHPGEFAGQWIAHDGRGVIADGPEDALRAQYGDNPSVVILKVPDNG